MAALHLLAPRLTAGRTCQFEDACGVAANDSPRGSSRGDRDDVPAPDDELSGYEVEAGSPDDKSSGYQVEAS